MADENYIPGQDASAQDASQAYQQALNNLMRSLDARKNRLFDPTLLAFAQAMLTPGQTGSFGEALGRAAGAVGTSEAQQAKEQQELAKMQLEVAQQGMQLERQKARERFLMGQIQPTAGAAPAGAPAGAPEAPAGPGAAPGAAPPQARAAASQPPGTEGIQGEPFMPPNPEIANKVSIVQAALRDPGKSVFDVVKEIQDLERRRTMSHPEGVVDLATGLLYRTKKPDITPVNIQLRTIPGLEGQTLSVPMTRAREHDDALKRAMSGDPGPLRALERSLTSTFAEQQPAEQGAVTSPVAPRTVQTSEQLAESAAAQKELAQSRAKSAAEKETQAEQKASAARTMLFNANRVQQLVSQSPQAFGIFARPGFASAIGNLINEGIRAGTTTVQLGGFENTVRQLMPNVSQKDLNNVTQAAGALAEIELAYTVLYMQKQGAITEGEREIVRRIGGNVSQSPGALMDKSKLIQLRSQHDINVNQAWRKFQDENPRANYNDFERSRQYREMLNEYDQTLSNAFKVAPPSQGPVRASDMKVRRVGQ